MTVAAQFGARGPAVGASPRLDALFAAQAAATPDAPALLHRGSVVRYGELEQRANRFAWRLLALGVGPGALVGVCMRRTPELVVALLGVLKAGAAYLPLDPAYPAERLDFMLADSAAAVLVTDCAVDASLAFRGVALDPRRDAAAIAAQPNHAPPVAGDGEDLAYVIYTSGSTGRPKGVMLAHTAAALIEWARTTFTSGQLERVAATTSVSFDPSVFEIFAPICTGGAVLLKESPLEPFAPGERPTMLNAVPAVLAELCRTGAIPDSVRTINVGGEPLKAELVREVYRRTAAEAVYNHYGPTEATTCTTVALAPRDAERDPPVGRPIAGAQVHILDDQGRRVPRGEIGEIHIGGPVLARGYLNRPELTAARFVEDQPGASGERLYRTGDLGRWSTAGELEFVGRADEQVKLKGVRIELGEVEAALMRLFAVRRAAAGVRWDRAGRPQLVAWLESDASFTLRGVGSALRDWLPDHMLPSRLCVIPAFPTTLTGKLDRNALPAPPEPPASPSPSPAPAALSRIEEAIAEAFKEVLQRDRVGAEDSFFELGGDSLLGVLAALRLEEILGQSIPPALLHQASTPRALAQALEQHPACQAQHLSLLQPGGEAAPLLCVADLFGRPFSYLSLTRRLALERASYGLSPGPLEAAFIADRSIPTLTKGYLAELFKARPHGPYLLAGYSAGGVMAFDLACALQAWGEPVALVLLDSAFRRRAPLSALARGALREGLPLLDPRTFRSQLKRLRSARESLAKALTPIERQAPPDWMPDSKTALASSLMQACAGYAPGGAFHGPTLLVKCLERDPVEDLFDHDGRLGWGEALAGPLTTVEVDGDHHGFMRAPRVDETVGHVGRFLREAFDGA